MCQIDNYIWLISLQKRSFKTNQKLLSPSPFIFKTTSFPRYVFFKTTLFNLPYIIFFPPTKNPSSILPFQWCHRGGIHTYSTTAANVHLEECHRVQLPTLTLAVPPSQAASRLPEIGDSRRKAGWLVGFWVVGWRDVTLLPGRMARVCKKKVMFFLAYVFPAQKFKDLVDLHYSMHGLIHWHDHFLE